VALIHHPVVDKNGDTIAAAVTALDLHDIARACKTYGIAAFHVVTPLEDQQVLVKRIIEHWVTGTGAAYNPDRREALALIRLHPSCGTLLADVEKQAGAKPFIVATSARTENSNLDYDKLRALVAGDKPVVLYFGTAWGLAQEIMESADYRLAPIKGCDKYNHLAVRSAVAIILDRMLNPFLSG
jgi:hypothetical protein